MVFTEVSRRIQAVSRNRGIPMTTLLEALRKAELVSDKAARKAERAARAREQKAAAAEIEKHLDRNGIPQLNSDNPFGEGEQP